MTEPINPAETKPEAFSPRRAALARSLHNLADYYSDLIYYEDGAVHTEIILEKHFPDLNWDRLLDLYVDSPDDWPYIIKHYLAQVAEDELEDGPEDRPEEKPPLRCIGTAPDLFTGELRPVYNRAPEPGEELPAAAAPQQPAGPE